MLALTLRGLGARKLRTALTATSIVLGVALVSGTFILTDTINRSFDRIFAQGASGYDVAVTPRQAVKSENVETPPISESLVARAQEQGAGRIAVESHRRRAVQQGCHFFGLVCPPGEDTHQIEGLFRGLPHRVLPRIEFSPVPAHGDDHQEREPRTRLQR